MFGQAEKGLDELALQDGPTAAAVFSDVYLLKLRNNSYFFLRKAFTSTVTYFLSAACLSGLTLKRQNFKVSDRETEREKTKIFPHVELEEKRPGEDIRVTEENNRRR